MERVRHIFRRQRGQSLPVVLLATGLLATISIITFKNLNQMHAKQERMSLKNQFENLLDEFRFLVDSPVYCEETFKDLVVNTDTHHFGENAQSQVLNLNDRNIGPLKSSDFFKNSNLELTGANLTILSNSQNLNSHKAKLNLVVRKKESPTELNFNSNSLRMDFDLNDENKVQSCRIYDESTSSGVGTLSSFKTATIEWGEIVINSPQHYMDYNNPDWRSSTNYDSLAQSSFSNGTVTNSSIEKLPVGSSARLPAGSYLFFGNLQFTSQATSQGNNRVDFLEITRSFDGETRSSRKFYSRGGRGSRITIPVTDSLQSFYSPYTTSFVIHNDGTLFNFLYAANCKQNPCPNYRIEKGSHGTLVKIR